MAFIAHALMPDYLSTALIGERLKEYGRAWPGSGENPGYIRWWSFPVVGPRPVWVDFYIIPLLAGAFMKAHADGSAYGYAEAVALAAIAEAQQDEVELTIGWGAATKNATGHGEKFLARYPNLPKVNSTHGDAGTAQLVIEGLRQAGVKRGSRVAVIGANGVTGDAISRAVVGMEPASILLVGRSDDPGQTRRHERLVALREKVLQTVGSGTEVIVDQDKAHACLQQGSDVVIVATTADMMTLNPGDVPTGALVMDMTTPSACRPDPQWEGRMVLTAGCGEMTNGFLKAGFGLLGGRRHDDVGAGGRRVMWGCALETFARATCGWQGHLAGVKEPIPLDALEWCHYHFNQLGIHPQPPLQFGRPLSWSAVRRFVSDAAAARKRR